MTHTKTLTFILTIFFGLTLSTLADEAVDPVDPVAVDKPTPEQQAEALMGIFELQGQFEGMTDAQKEEIRADFEQEMIQRDSIQWTDGPDTVGQLRNEATIKIPAGYTFTNREGTDRLMEIFGNIPSPDRYGLIAPEGIKSPLSDDWFIVFTFDDIGYVKDDDKDSLDPDELMKQMKAGAVEANKIRRERGLPSMTPVGWAVPPNYNEQTKNLEWAIEFSDDEGNKTVNHQTKVLGRKGVMNVVLVCDPSELQSIIPTSRDLIKGFTYVPGNTYAEYKKGDRIAKGGLTALVVGGGLALAAKSGLLSKLIKPLILGIIAFFAFFGKIFKRK